MTVIKLDAATLAKVKAGTDPVFLGDESGVRLLRITVLPDAPTSEPDLPPEEWRRRMNSTGGLTTAQLQEHLRRLGNQ
ncbi:MAG TPA: hypothetical protein VLM40_08400 [Gemmata sp.]|nr:hypothetical protein [Gemmata sp.]